MSIGKSFVYMVEETLIPELKYKVTRPYSISNTEINLRWTIELNGKTRRNRFLRGKKIIPS